MALREYVPPALDPGLRKAYVLIGSATASLRLLPGFLVVGGQRCGTTSIFHALAAHPQVHRPPVNKGTDYFTLHYAKGPDWYRGHFPLTQVAGRRSGRFGPAVAFEACTYYLFHPYALERIARDLPDIKLVAMLRDPVERSFSAYKHEFGRGFEWEPTFERALDLEEERLIDEDDRMRTDMTYESFTHRHHAYRLRSRYAPQLERAIDFFGRERIHVMYSETFFEAPEAEFARLLDFLGLRQWAPDHFSQLNARPSDAMQSSTRRRLQADFAADNARLIELVGTAPRWADN